MGEPGKDYCLVADKRVHVNMHVFAGKREGTTYISEVGLLVDSDEVYVSAKSTDSAGWKDFHGMVLVNGIELPASDVSMTLSDGLSIAREKTRVRISKPGVLDVTLDIARASFWENGPGQNFINFKVTSLNVSPAVHGVLGQTYRENERTYKKLAAGTEHKKQRSNGMPYYVDGEETDYLTSGIMAADCKFARFSGSNVPTGARKMLSSEDRTLLVAGSGFGDY